MGCLRRLGVSLASYFSHEAGVFLMGLNRLFRWFSGLDRREVPSERDVDRLFMRAREKVRAGELNDTANLFDEAIALDPTFAEAIEWRGEVLDMLGHTDQSAAAYEASRKARASAKRAAPDRSFVLRQQRRLAAHIASYTEVIHSRAGTCLSAHRAWQCISGRQ